MLIVPFPLSLFDCFFLPRVPSCHGTLPGQARQQAAAAAVAVGGAHRDEAPAGLGACDGRHPGHTGGEGDGNDDAGGGIAGGCQGPNTRRRLSPPPPPQMLSQPSSGAPLPGGSADVNLQVRARVAAMQAC